MTAKKALELLSQNKVQFAGGVELVDFIIVAYNALYEQMRREERADGQA